MIRHLSAPFFAEDNTDTLMESRGAEQSLPTALIGNGINLALGVVIEVFLSPLDGAERMNHHG